MPPKEKVTLETKEVAMTKSQKNSSVKIKSDSKVIKKLNVRTE